LAGEVVFLSGLGRAQPLALAFEEHGQAAADLVLIGNQEGATGTCETEHFFGERNLHSKRAVGRWLCVK
jgi:hypothetical protein